MRLFWHLFVVVFMALPAFSAEDNIVRVKAEGSVSETADRLEAAVVDAGASAFLRVNNATLAEAAGLELAPSELVIFGNPKFGTKIMQDNPLAGIFLPMRVLVYQDKDGQVWLAYQKPEAMFADITLPEGAEYIGKMGEILAKMTSVASK